MDIFGLINQPSYLSNAEQIVIDYILAEPNILKKVTIQRKTTTKFKKSLTPFLEE